MRTMRGRTLGLVLALVGVCVFGLPAIADWDPGDEHKMHYPQLPDLDGWDISLHNLPPLGGALLADDWMCTESGWIDDIHFWTSWRYDTDPQVISVRVRIYNNYPVGHPNNPYNYSIPGDLLSGPGDWVFDLAAGSFTQRHYAFGEQGWFDPRSGEWVLGDHNNCYQINITNIRDIIDEDRWVYQNEGEIYWLSIRVIQNIDNHFTGWKNADTSLNPQFMDAAVYYNPSVVAPHWSMLRDPITMEPLDLAFVITSEPEELGACCYSLVAGGPTIFCVTTTEEACISGFSGVYEGDGTLCEGEEACCLPDNSCVNADAMCCRVELGGTPQGAGTQCSQTEACCLNDGSGVCMDLDPICCDEAGGTPQGAGTVCGLATIACCLPDGSCQDVDVLCCDEMGGTPAYQPSCMGDGNGNGIDDACEIIMACCLQDGTCVDTNHTDCVMQGGDPQGPGTDCATTVCTPLKWAQPPMYNTGSPYPDCFWGWDHASVYGTLLIAADDFLCADPRPITDIHWWGSYVGWGETTPPPNAPDAFHIGIWTDNPGPPSHPQQMVFEWIVSRDVLNERYVGCDFHPQHAADPSEACFRYDFVIPDGEWFYQEEPSTVYWLSIAAVYASTEPEYQWGWKTREHAFNDYAHQFYPSNPTLGSQYLFGVVISEGWDLSFVLTTQAQQPIGACCYSPAGAAYDQCIETTQFDCINNYGGIYEGDGTVCEGIEACCLADGMCIDADALCCRVELGGAPQGSGSACFGMTIACCLPDGGCVDVDPLCCDELGGWISAEPACLGDGDDNGIDDACESGYPSALKWDQPPEPIVPSNLYYGWNEPSEWWWGPIVADDWYCDTADPVTDIHWWGSFLEWRRDYPPPDGIPTHFHIQFWTDVPAGVDAEFSHPGYVIHEIYCYNFTYEFVGWDYDPLRDTYEACFKFEQDLIPDEYFYQEPGGSVYWISIAACYEGAYFPEHPWGWKTRPRTADTLAPDAAVVVEDPAQPVLGSQYSWGYPLRGMLQFDDEWDMAFELTSRTPPLLKWEQLPDETTSGLHCHDWAGGFEMLADDWLCEGGLVTDFHWYGNYENNNHGLGIIDFELSIYGPPCGTGAAGFHVPGEPPLVTYTIQFDEANETDSGYVNNVQETVYLYSWDLPVPFEQIAGEYYWVSILAHVVAPGDPNQAFWRWMEADRSPAILGHAPAAERGPTMPWSSIVWDAFPPVRYSDLAFAVSSGGGSEPYVKWSQPPQPYYPEDGYNGWNEYSLYWSPQIAADDWFCDTDFPVTDIHWWGSFLDWCEVFPPPELPVAFHIGIWTENPEPCMSAGPYGPYSCPLMMIHEIICDRYSIEFVGWDFDPRVDETWNPPPEACFYFQQDLDPSLWFFQESGENMYWISIAAMYDGGQPELYPWGWKTRPRDLASLAPDDGIVIFEPTAPVVGSMYGAGGPQYWPDPVPENSWDYAFQLTTLGCDTPGDMNMDGVINGLDIQCFVNCLIYGFAACTPECNCACADMGGPFGVPDGKLTLADVMPFVNALLGGP